MKRILSLFLIVSLFFGVSLVKVQSVDDFTHLEGESFVYDIITSNIDVTVRKTHYAVDTFQFDQQQFSTDNPVAVTLTESDDIAYNYSMTCDGYIANKSTADLPLYKEIAFMNYLFQSFLLATYFQHDYSEGNISSGFFGIGLQLELIFFIIANQSSWNDFQEIADWIASPTFENPEEHSSFFSNSSYHESDGLVYLEGYLQTTYESTEVDYDGTTSHVFLASYNMSNGVLCGLKSKGSFDGEILGDTVNCKTEFHIELAGYDLPEYRLFTETTGTTMVYLVTIGCFILIIGIVINRRKRFTN